MIRGKLGKLVFILLGVIVITSSLVVIKMSSKDCIITIENNTDITITGLEIKYSNSVNNFKLPAIPKKQTYKTDLVLPDNFTEGSIKIIYVDYKLQNHEEYIEGYIEKGYNTKVNVAIDSVDNNGVLSIKVHE